MSTMIEEFKETHRLRTAEVYQCTLNCFIKFYGSADISIGRLTRDLVKRFEDYMRSNGLSLNTTSFYLRTLRAVYNRAVGSAILADEHPFGGVFTGNAATAKRALSLEQIKSIAHYVTADPHIAFARDMFLFSFLTRGMAFVDMAYLTPASVIHGWLRYHRHKTGQEIVIRWEPIMQQLVDRYASRCPSSGYLLPIIGKSNGKERNQYRSVQTAVNRALKPIARALNIPSNLTMYVARHSWASIAQELNVPLSVISRAMGHTSEKTTRIYLTELDIHKVDVANNLIISNIL